MTNSNNDKKEIEAIKDDIQKIERDNYTTREYFEKKIDSIRESNIIWNQLEEYTIPYIYLQKIKEINLFLDSIHYPDIINTYRINCINDKWNHDLPYTFHTYQLKDKDFKKISIENSIFLKNSKIFSDISSTLYWDSRPVLSYYSISQLFSFFINSITIFPHDTKTYHHGLRVDINDNPENLGIKFNESGGSFHRVVKTFSFIFNGSIFSDCLIDFSEDMKKVILYPNNNIFSIENGKQKSFPLKKLYELSDSDIKSIFEKIDTNWIHTEMKKRYLHTTKLLKNYILIFTAGFLSRYYPYLWEKIYNNDLSGEFLHYKKAIENIDDIVSFISDELKRFEEKKQDNFSVNLNKVYFS